MKESILKLLEAAKNWSSNMPDDERLPFSILHTMYNRISSKELLHSEIIAELLRPDGKHDCGDIFLQEFMSAIDIDPRQQDFSQVEVLSESPTDEGRRIDILIVWGDKAVIVENKLNNAVDQPNQLKDYLQDTKNKNKQVLKVVYIPLYAWRKTHENLSADVAYLDPQKLSCWLLACMEKSPGARDVALPYIQLLNYMNQSNRNYMKAQELYEILKQDPELTNTALNLVNTITIDNLKKILREQLLEKIKGQVNGDDIKHDILSTTSELWLKLLYADYKYWVSVDVRDKYYIYLYFDNEAEKPEGEQIDKENCGHDNSGYYYQLSENYRIGDEAETDRLVARIVELLEKSRK